MRQICERKKKTIAWGTHIFQNAARAMFRTCPHACPKRKVNNADLLSRCAFYVIALRKKNNVRARYETRRNIYVSERAYLQYKGNPFVCGSPEFRNLRTRVCVSRIQHGYIARGHGEGGSCVGRRTGATHSDHRVYRTRTRWERDNEENAHTPGGAFIVDYSRVW